MRALRFGAVGIANTAVDIAIFSFLSLLVGVPVVAANVVSYSAGILTSFLLNRAWTFRDRRHGRPWTQLMLFALGCLAALALSTAVVAVLAKVWGPLLAKVASIGATFVWNFIFSNLVVFRANRPAQ